MRYESMVMVMRILNRQDKQASDLLSVKQIRARMKRSSDEGIRKILRELYDKGYVVKFVEEIEKKASPGRARHLWAISSHGAAWLSTQ